MKIILSIIFFSICFLSFSQDRTKAYEINKKLGQGINYGNMFEAPSETAWNNQWLPIYPKIIANLGFSHVRIPVRWEPTERSSETAPYTINQAFLNRIKQVVDSTLNNGMYAIINMHHHEALYENPEQQKERFLSMWKQISVFFADYPDSLLFEVLNEPHGSLSASKWNTFLADGLLTIRENNPKRIVLIGLAEYGGLAGLSKIQLPDDENIILTVHYYSPFPFTHQGASWANGSDDWLGTEWTNTETERQVIRNDFAPLVTFEKNNNIPIHMGEFGAYEKADMDSRIKWTNFIARYLESLNWSWAYWEFNAGFGVYNHNTNSYKLDLIDALLNDDMYKPATFVGTSIYTSNFKQTIDDWNLYKNGGANATKIKSTDNLLVAITSAGNEGWHLQLAKTNIKLEKKKKYRLTVKARAEKNRNISVYVGQNSEPWTAYSGYNGFTVSDTFAVFTIVFDMNITDNSARIVIDLGGNTNNFILDYVLFEEIRIQQPNSSNLVKNVKSKIYPNPTYNRLIIDNQDDFQELTIYNLQGILKHRGILAPSINATDLSSLTSGIYFVQLSNNTESITTKIIKN